LKRVSIRLTTAGCAAAWSTCSPGSVCGVAGTAAATHGPEVKDPTQMAARPRGLESAVRGRSAAAAAAAAPHARACARATTCAHLDVVEAGGQALLHRAAGFVERDRHVRREGAVPRGLFIGAHDQLPVPLSQSAQCCETKGGTYQNKLTNVFCQSPTPCLSGGKDGQRLHTPGTPGTAKGSWPAHSYWEEAFVNM
jgi:hypothetical protein